MKISANTILAYIHILLQAAIFGFFYAFACSVMIGFDYADARTAIPAMQAINATIKNPYFAPAFFGPMIPGLIYTVILMKSNSKIARNWIFSSTIIYIAAAMLPNMLINVPMNDAFANLTVPTDTHNAQIIWDNYANNWNFWNLVRTFAAAIAFVCALGALTQHRPQTNNQ